MKATELNEAIVVAAIKAAGDISAAKIAVIGDDFNRDHNFFDREFKRVLDTILKICGEE